ncbi:GILT-like protein 1 [Homalodisca vitripennis]|uniref:GILT-like protein 1 n=1 Tax=Homalodisca vitripennis TaxID=197043 RepID=UPI001EECBF5B|nr:GILT-like protein 1 [Homalodisca vitripennis]XP_046668356.1 GILT-like protein 1 [Homalodisca vitripennis]KAG8327728.1 antigen processing and presentation of exogenous peptide antigen via MHC class I [Homalodisca vitripennis]
MSRLVIFTALVALTWMQCEAYEFRPVGNRKVFHEPMLLSVYYESYCPNSIKFINDQLYDAWMFNNPFVLVEMVPFGNAKQSYSDGRITFTCEHGPKECMGNTLHACGIHNACHGQTTKDCPNTDVTKALNYIRCLVHHEDQYHSRHKCANEAGLDERAIDECVEGKLGNTLTSRYGNDTMAMIKTPIDSTPFITINGKHDETEQYEAQTQLLVLICKYLPDNCPHSL